MNGDAFVSEEGVAWGRFGELYCNSIFMAEKVHEEIDKEKSFPWRNRVSVKFKLKDAIPAYTRLPCDIGIFRLL